MTDDMPPMDVKLPADKLIGPHAGTCVADLMNTILEIFGPAAAERFAVGALASALGVLPVAVGDARAVEIFEGALTVLRLRIASGESYGGAAAPPSVQ